MVAILERYEPESKVTTNEKDATVKLSDFLKRTKATIKGGLTGLILWPLLVLAAIPLAIASAHERNKSIDNPDDKRSLLLAALFGLLAMPIIAIAGVALPFYCAKRGYKHQLKVENALKKNKHLLAFLNNYKDDPEQRTLSSDQVAEFELLIDATTDEALKNQYQQLLANIQGDTATTPILLEDYYALKQPITISQVVTKETGEIRHHEQIYDLEEFSKHALKLIQNGKSATNPLIASHKFKLDSNYCSQHKDEDGSTTEYKFSYGFSNTVKNSIEEIHNVLAAQPKLTDSTNLMHSKLNVHHVTSLPAASKPPKKSSPVKAERKKLSPALRAGAEEVATPRVRRG